MFVGRRLDGTIYGTWTIKQPDDEFHQGMEELSDDHPDVIAFLAPKPVIKQPTLDDVVSVLKERDATFRVALDAKISDEGTK